MCSSENVAAVVSIAMPKLFLKVALVTFTLRTFFNILIRAHAKVKVMLWMTG